MSDFLRLYNSQHSNIWASHHERDVSGLLRVHSLTCDGGVDVPLLYQQVPRTLWKPWQQHQLDHGRKHHQRQEQRPVLFLCGNKTWHLTKTSLNGTISSFYSSVYSNTLKGCKCEMGYKPVSFFSLIFLCDCPTHQQPPLYCIRQMERASPHPVRPERGRKRHGLEEEEESYTASWT